MKKQILTLLGVVTLVITLTTNLSAQENASATWALTDNQQAVVVGNVDADSSLGHVLQVRNYSTAMGGPLGANQARWWMGFLPGSTNTGANWPASTGQENNLYIDFVVSPKAGYNFSVDSVKASLGGGGTNNMRANAYWGGTDTSLATLTPLNTTPYLLKQYSYYASGAADTNVAYYIGQQINNGQKFRFRVYAWYLSTSTSGSKYLYTQNIVISGTTTLAVSVEEETEIPTSFELQQNYPNPFNPSTNINFSLNQDGNVKLVVFNSIGQEVATILNGFLPSGKHNLKFDASNLPTGVYIYRLITSTQSLTKKMMLIR